MESVSHIDLNFQKPSMQPAIYAKQGDMLSRKIKARLFDGQQAWVPPTNNEVKVIVRCFKPDGTICFYDTTEDDLPAVVTGSTNEITIMLAQQCLTAAGDVKMEINFYTAASSNDEDATGEKLTTFSAVIRVEKSVIDDVSMQSDSYFRVLTSEITRALNAVEYITNLEVGLMPNYSSEEPDVSITGGISSPYKISFGLPKGPKGDTAVITSSSYRYARTSAFDRPVASSSEWKSTSPQPLSGTYSWTERTDTYNEDDTKTVTTYFCVRNGLDGAGTVSSVAGTAVAEGTTDVPTVGLLANLKAGLVDMLYPVGSIYMTKSDTSPATTFGGTWVEIESRFLVGAGTLYTRSQDQLSRSNKTYYVKSGSIITPRTYSTTTDIRNIELYEKLELTCDDTGGDFQHRLTYNELTPHYHKHGFVMGNANPTGYVSDANGFLHGGFNAIDTRSAYRAVIGDDRYYSGYENTNTTGGDTSLKLSDNSYFNDNASFSILPPYVVVHIWERTA